MKVFLIVTKSDTVLTFRRGLIKELRQRGHEVGIIAHDADRKQDISELGVTFYCVDQDNRSLNPLAVLRYQRKINKILTAESPDIVFTFQLKPNTFGVYGAKMAGVSKIFCMVEGAGDAFINQSPKWRLIRLVVCMLYRSAFKYARKVFFLNGDDKAEFIKRNLLDAPKSDIIHGVGVDLDRFAYRPVKNQRIFLMVARMLKTKGIFEYCKCARIVKQKYPDTQFQYLGAEGTVRLADIREYIEDGSVNYLGTTSDVRPYLEECVLLLLPSYREGLPMSIMEAEAIGRGILTCDNIGCKDTVVEGYNGFLVQKGDYKTMAQKCIYVIEHPEEAIRMGANSRSFAEEQFDQKKINQRLVSILENE